MASHNRRALNAYKHRWSLGGLLSLVTPIPVPASTRLTAPSFIAHTIALSRAKHGERESYLIDVRAIARLHGLTRTRRVPPNIAATIEWTVWAVLEAGEVPGWRVEREIDARGLVIRCTRAPRDGVAELVLATAS